MARIQKKSIRQLDDFPGLFDLPPVSEKGNAVYDVMMTHRTRQSTPDKTMGYTEIDRHLKETTPRYNELEFISFGSGSSGNCAYIGLRGLGGVLIDAGVDYKTVLSELERNYIPLDKISGIIITHDHSDHVRYAYSLIRKNPKMLVYCTPRTLSGILRRHNISSRIKDYHKPIFKEFEFQAGPLTITPFEVSHDGTDNVGFSITVSGKRFVIATDMGILTDRADFYIRKANYLMIETNYDDNMLETGRYPLHLKARIRSNVGHLCNDFTASYLSGIWEPKLTDIFLCHLSEDNNTPELALHTVKSGLEGRGTTVGDGSASASALEANVQLVALPRYDSSPHFILRLDKNI